MTASKGGEVITAAFDKARLDRAARQLGGGPKASRNGAGAGAARVESPETAKGDPGWQRLLLEGLSGAIACEANVAIALRHAPELAGRLRFDVLAGTVECSGLPWRAHEGWRAWTDEDDTALAVWCQHAGIRVKPAACAAAAQLVASDHPHHPVRAYLDGLRWDGTPRLDAWLHNYLGVEIEAAAEGATDAERAAAAAKNAFVRQVGRKWIVSAVARAYEPGCKADHALILEGKQRAGKSSALAALVPNTAWFADEISDLGSKDSAQDLRGKWIIELAELSAMRRPEVERTKAFMSRQVDHYRPSYGRRSQDFPRQGIFGGTTNGDAYLGDETGGRRFWPVKVGLIKLAALRRDRDQLWAEAVVAYRAGETWWLDAAVEIAAAEQQAERRVGDPWEEELLDWAERQKLPFTVGEALAGAVKVPIERQDQAAMNRVARVLKAHGWKRTHKREGDRYRWVYVHPDPAPDASPDPGTPTGHNAGVTSTNGPTGHGSDHAGGDHATPPAQDHTGHNADVTSTSGHTGHGKTQQIRGCDQCDQSVGINTCAHAHIEVPEQDWSRGHTGHGSGPSTVEPEMVELADELV